MLTKARKEIGVLHKMMFISFKRVRVLYLYGNNTIFILIIIIIIIIIIYIYIKDNIVIVEFQQL